MRIRTELASFMAQIEGLWQHQDALFAELNATNGWGQRHGLHWTFADMPYHLAYCNRDVIAYALEKGENYPVDEQVPLANMEALNAWNGQKFAQRPTGQTLQESLAELYASREAIRRVTSQMTDEDLASPCFHLFMAGWVTKWHLLNFCRVHDWSEFMQLRIHMGKLEPVPSAETTRAYLDTMLYIFPMMLNGEAAAGKDFATVIAFTDPEVGAWTIRVADGAATVQAGEAETPNLVITQSAETFEKTFRGIQTFPAAMQAGLIQISEMDALGTFGELFPM